MKNSMFLVLLLGLGLSKAYSQASPDGKFDLRPLTAINAPEAAQPVNCPIYFESGAEIRCNAAVRRAADFASGLPPLDDVRGGMAVLKPKVGKYGDEYVTTVASLLRTESAKRDIDWRLAVALCDVESGFWHKATNWSTGCYGLMQVQWRSHRTRYGLGKADQLYDPETNVRCGMDILRRYTDAAGSTKGGLRKYGTNVERVLSRFEKVCAEYPDGP